MQKGKMTLAGLEIFLPINTYYWNMAQICNAFVFFYSRRLYCDTIFAAPIAPQISAVKNFWVAARVKKKTSHWKCKSSVKNLNLLSETEWNV